MFVTYLHEAAYCVIFSLGILLYTASQRAVTAPSAIAFTPPGTDPASPVPYSGDHVRQRLSDLGI